MPFCPTCLFEYVPEVTECPTCKVRLVAARPPRPARSEEEAEQVLLCTTEGMIHAQLLQTALKEQGIPTRLQPGWSYDELLGAVGAPPPPIGGTEGTLVAVFVARADEARARIDISRSGRNAGSGRAGGRGERGMTNRERVQTALRQETPDRIPIDLGGTECTSV